MKLRNASLLDLRKSDEKSIMRNRYLRHYTCGFTLIELLVVIAVIAILLTLLVPALQHAKAQAKLAICAVNQRSVITGVLQYACENKDKLPPSVLGKDSNSNGYPDPKDQWTRPQRLSYHAAGGDGFFGGAIGPFLKRYIRNVEFYSCPLSTHKADDMMINGVEPESSPYVTNGKSTYQHLYETGNSYILDNSYFLLWNYQGFNNPYCERRFIGPDNKSKKANELIVCDGLSWNEHKKRSWWANHPFKNATPPNPQAGVYTHGIDFYYSRFDAQRSDMPDIWMNAGYVDGHVERFHTFETVEVNVNLQFCPMWIPSDF